MSKSIVELTNELPNGGTTVKVLNALDFVMPGEWTNLVGFDATVTAITGESDSEVISQVADRAIDLYNDKSQGYQTAIWLYQTVDSAGSALGAAALANKIGQDFSFLGFLKNLTPKPEKAQAIDLSIKTVVELLAFCQINGIPGDSIGDFLGAIGDYTGESKMRIAGLVTLDGLVPLGPNFIQSASEFIANAGESAFNENPVFNSVKDLIPGGSGAAKLGFISESFNSISGTLSRFATDRGLTPQNVLGALKGAIDLADDKLDYVGAFLDVSTNYYYHTGVQTLAKRLIDRAFAEI